MVNRDVEFYFETLHTKPFFERFTADEMHQIRSQSVVHQYRKGQILFFQADPRIYSFYLLKGLIRLEKTDYSGEYTYLDYIKADTFFPYGGLFGDSTYTHSAYSGTDIDLLLIPNQLLKQILAHNNEQLMYMYTKIAENLKFQESRIQQTAISSATERVIQTLALWMHDMVVASEDKIVIPYPLTINELASAAGTTRETAGKVVRDLASDGKIDFNRRNIQFLKKEAFSLI